MKLNLQEKKLTIIVIVILIGFSTLVFLIDWVDENVANPRIWDDWSCEEMKKYAMAFEDENLNDFQRAKFHEDLSHCLKG